MPVTAVDGTVARAQRRRPRRRGATGAAGGAVPRRDALRGITDAGRPGAVAAPDFNAFR